MFQGIPCVLVGTAWHVGRHCSSYCPSFRQQLPGTPRFAFQGLLVSSVLHLGEKPLRVLRAAWAMLSDETMDEGGQEITWELLSVTCL